ncbi:MAG: prepilin-type N-terminal cleavage/methylation domain-containing protein [Phycisphaerae bacterium]|jgi:type II secretory pathway pseudopilin PulG|nr:prepilin-type N-terminal cleavage/methylation domain-containing protein [Phycisphaerae bacterium]
MASHNPTRSTFVAPLLDRRRPRSTGVRRNRFGFTLVELIVAGMVSVIVVGAITISLSKIGRGREVTARRLDAHIRATLALDAVRRDVASVMRSADLFESRLLIQDGSVSNRLGDLDRDELLVFSNRLTTARPADQYQGEGNEYETQIRIMDDELGSALWMRRDPVPDRNPDAGGVAIPTVDGVVSLQMEAYDGESWYPDWDSDLYGYPWAVRVSVTAAGRKNGEDPIFDNEAFVTLRTTVAIDRIIPPLNEEEEASKEENAAEEGAEAAEDAMQNGGAGGGVPVDGPRPGGDRPGEGPGRGPGEGPGGGAGGGSGGPRGGGGNQFAPRGGRGGRGTGGLGQSRGAR